MVSASSLIAVALLEWGLVEVTARYFVASVLLMAGLVKLASPNLFARDIAAYRLLPGGISLPVAVLIPPIESALAILLFADIQSPLVALAAATLFLAFLGATAITMLRGINTNCGCFGLLYRERLGRHVLIRDGILLACAIYVAQFEAVRLGLSSVSEGPLQPAGMLVAGLLSAAAVIVFWAVLSSLRAAFRGERGLRTS